MSADVPLCEVCGLHPASVFDPSFAMWCAACDSVGLGAYAVKLKVGVVPPGPSTFDVDSPTGMVDYGAINRQWREQAGEPNDAETLDDADKAYVWQDSLGAHWGWLNGSGWVAWNSGLYVQGRGAVAPFAVAYKRPATGDFAPMLLDLGNGLTFGVDMRRGPSNEAGEPSTSANADASNGCGPDDVCTQALGGEHVHLGHYDEGTPVEVDESDDSGDMVNHPSHYTQGPPCKGCGRPIECLDITEGMGFCLGNTVKYVWRCDLKHDAIEDLRKARVYLDREIARREAQLVANFKNRNTTKGIGAPQP
ncbi:hypothetical protein I5G80_gp088 [Mycobacterium phage Krueger]|uniref:Uncharacterized protein n=1 Tax=Mycobacterium phage Krueger TaxID=2015820 RepID=A0A222ZM56_9CAUD|nr:hypothetical protein I5G80_gp088 [Mycobacterium phage Krueger]ASR85558.1 hypothetical protein SEA_KRUEGER_58 [Mycobacterium phage Krueger]